MTTTQAEMVTVRVFGALRQAIGRSEVQLPYADETVRGTLLRLTADSDAEISGYIFDKQGNVWRSLMLLVNDEPVEDALQQATRPGDVICLLLPVAGG